MRPVGTFTSMFRSSSLSLASGFGFLVLITVSHLSGAAKQKSADLPVVRWAPGAPGSTFTTTDDGKYHYTLKDEGLEVSVAVDSQELEKVRHRPLPILGLLIEAHYSGKKSLDFGTEHISLEFVRHYQVVNIALDPDDLNTRIQNDADNLSDEVEHQIRKQPETKPAQEALLQAHLKDMTDLMGFISVHCLRPATLDPGNPEADGWVFFSTRSKWIGAWKTQEEFVLRIPLQDRILEFPLALPPHKGEMVLRRRDR